MQRTRGTHRLQRIGWARLVLRPASEGNSVGRPVGSKNKRTRTARTENSGENWMLIGGGAVDTDDDAELDGLDIDADDDKDYDEDDEPDEEKVKRVRVAAKTLPPTQKTQLMFGLPAGLKALVEEAAEKEDVAAGALVRDLIAKHFEYTLPPEAQRGARKRYNSEEERVAAQKAATAKRNATVRELIKRYNAGEIQLPAEVTAMLSALGTPEPVTASSDESEASE